MDMILRGVAMYALLWVVFRLSGRRTMGEMTTFDFVLLLICGEATQQSLLDEDFSFTNATIVILTIICLDRAMGRWRVNSKRVERVVEGLPVLIMADGELRREPMRRERVDEEDILHEARRSHGLSRLDEIRHAILEPSGEISIIPRKEEG
jgi:uncharacterized membrane protein YcaP (DUF421 family)